MKRLMILVLLPFFWIVNASAAQPAVMIQSESVTIHIKENGAVEKNVSVTMKLNTFKALRTVGEWFYSYNPKLEKVDILKSVTIHKDGKQFSAPINAILDQSPASVENAPDFSSIREKMVSHTGLEPGCTVEFQYKTTDLSPHRCGILEPMGGPWPIQKKTVTIQLDRKVDIKVNGNVTQPSPGVYEVRNTVSERPAPGFSSALDLPFVYISIDNPVNRVKQLLNRAKTPESAILDALKLNKNSTPLEVETALNHLLNKRITTVHLEPELTGWTSRSLSQVVQSGYTTSLEKLLLAHCVLNTFQILHTAALRTDAISGTPIAIHPDFQLDSSLVHLVPESASRPAFPLWGQAVSNKPGTTVTIRADLEEQEDGSFSGTLTARQDKIGTDFSLATMNPVKNATLTAETVMLKTGNSLVKTGKIDLKLKDKEIQIIPVLSRVLHLAGLEHAILNATSIRMAAPCMGVVHVSITFRKETNLALPTKMSASTRFGTAVSLWKMQGRTLTIEQKFQARTFKAERKDFNMVNRLLVPIMNEAATVAFVE